MGGIRVYDLDKPPLGVRASHLAADVKQMTAMPQLRDGSAFVVRLHLV